MATADPRVTRALEIIRNRRLNDEFLARLLDLWTREKERLAGADVCPHCGTAQRDPNEATLLLKQLEEILSRGETLEQLVRRLANQRGYTPLRLRVR